MTLTTALVAFSATAVGVATETTSSGTTEATSLAAFLAWLSAVSGDVTFLTA